MESNVGICEMEPLEFPSAFSIQALHCLPPQCLTKNLLLVESQC